MPFLSNLLCTKAFKDSSVIMAELPSGKGDKKHLTVFQELLRELFKLDVKIACITDNDYDLALSCEEERVDNSKPLFLRIGRKEIENYLLDPNTIAEAAASLAEDRKKHIGTDVRYPTAEEVKQAVSKILNKTEIRTTVKCQTVPQFRETLDNKLDPSTKEREGEKWFDKQWQDENWRIRNCPGKEVLSLLRTWCQNEFSLSLTNRRLVDNLKDCPEDILDIAEKLESYFYSRHSAP